MNANGELIILSGPAGSGKSVLSAQLSLRTLIEVISLDDVKVEKYKQYGFITETERKLIRQLAVREFCARVIDHVITGKSMIVEYPFEEKWNEFFQYISTEYHYKLILVKCERPLEDLLNESVKRYSELTKREPCLISEKYLSDEAYQVAVHKIINPTEVLQRIDNIKAGTWYNIKADVVYSSNQIWERITKDTQH